ncbi:Geminivirus AL1 replication-associated catalytic domain [Pyrenophora seminiperda CCB06]|uniref:Geminivirus AL1 replication-associated catalytic domain n=1 Tax=Pyrenophora seminiperda CCB06 TaxID=1302712 RepID=A0A3M7MCZ2_9PLEO|nr:Geminivirus AL1 replication-associated catalytic domain [Pyrenophora seminiperda CCB06]
MPYGTEMYGCKELHQDGTPHYHAVLRFPKAAKWANAAEHFVMRDEVGEVDTKAIHFRVPTYYQRESDFLRKTQGYCDKFEDSIMFGKLIEVLSAAESLKRKFIAVHDEPEYGEAKRMLQAADPVGFIKHHPSYMSYLENEKRMAYRSGSGWDLPAEETLPWRVPEEMRAWQEKYLSGTFVGRPVPLLIIGGPRLGKTLWAIRAGERPMVMSGWNMRKYSPSASHIVLNDVDFRRFGSGGHQYWREVLGCQAEFDAHDRYCRTKTLKWLFPAVVTCNFDNDPRRVPEIAEYLRQSPCVVVELLERLY